MILCLIDGDGNIFSADLIKQGQFGGDQAAMLLTKGLTDYLASVDPTDASAPSRGQLWLTIYCNKNGLVETLTNNHVCTPEEFEAEDEQHGADAEGEEEDLDQSTQHQHVSAVPDP